MGRTYERLPIEVFGRHLLMSNDLDPIYVALKAADFDDNQLKRWMIAYWCLYHAGAASYLSELHGRDFWMGLRAAAKNDEPAPTATSGPMPENDPYRRWPRGHERRHFRGEAAVKAVRTMMGLYLETPEQLVNDIIDVEVEGTHMTPVLDFRTIAARAQKLPLFGPWISFKVGDMIDRVLGITVDFSNDAVFMFKDPTEAALKLWRIKAGLHEAAQPKDPKKAIQDVVDYLTEHFSYAKAPPLSDRPVGLQEVETILCKWKSHMNGHYPLNNDIDEIREGIHPWMMVSETARKFLDWMPRRVAVERLLATS